MSPSGKSIVTISLVWFVIFTIYGCHRNSTILQLLDMGISLLFLGAFVLGFICIFSEWKQRRWLSLLPFTVCVLSVVVSIEITERVRAIIFIHCLPSYQAVAQEMESGAIPVSTNLSRVPQAVPMAKLAYVVMAQKADNGVLVVEFVTEGGFPVKHSGYLYSSAGAIQPGSVESLRWPAIVPVRTNWFFVTD